MMLTRTTLRWSTELRRYRNRMCHDQRPIIINYLNYYFKTEARHVRRISVMHTVLKSETKAKTIKRFSM